MGGFTIPELGFVVTLILILSLVTVTAYRGVQARSRDSVRKSDIGQLVKATQQYKIAVGDYGEAGCGWSTAASIGSGWLHQDYDTTGPRLAVIDCLVTGNYLDKALKDPSGLNNCNGLTCHAYMKLSCPSTGANPGVWFGAHLETLPQTTTDTDGTCLPTWDTGYGINYLVKVD